ncbi:NEDD8 protease Nep2 [Chamberlinius hualienensis]
MKRISKKLSRKLNRGIVISCRICLQIDRYIMDKVDSVNEKVQGMSGSAVTVHMNNSTAYLTTIKKLTWWQRRTRMEKRLMLLGLFVFLVLTGFVIAYILASTKDPWQDLLTKGEFKASDLCTNTDCLNAAKYAIQSIDNDVDPCDDFYEFACGGWINRNRIPDDRSRFSVFAEMHNDLYLQLRRELEKPKISTDILAVQYGKEVYSACMNTAEADKYGKKYFIEWINSYGGWPLAMKKWNRSSFDWKEIIIRQSQESAFYFISTAVYADVRNTSVNIVHVNFVGSAIDGDFLLKPNSHKKINSEYKHFIKEMAEILTGEKVTVNQSDIDEIIAFETVLANISETESDSEEFEDQFQKITIEELNNVTKHKFDWQYYLNSVFEGIKNFTENETLIVSQPISLLKLFELIEETDNRTIANYLMWRYLLKYAWHINNVTRDRTFKFLQSINGVQVQEPRWESCVDIMNEMLPHVMGSLYVTKYVEKGTKEQAETMIEDIRVSLNDVLQSNTWMDKETLTKAIEKANALVQFVAYPDWIANETVLNGHLEGFVPSDIHIENIRNANTIIKNISFAHINKPFDRSAWITTPSTVNAFYSFSANSITFPAGILQRPFFSAKNLKAMNYGAVGTIIGHEMTHAFDNGGRQNDKDGNLVQWWTNNSLEAYHTKTKCMRKQYGQYCFDDLQTALNWSDPICVKGNETLSENIADNGGFKISYSAYKSWVQKNGEEKRLPGLTKYTPEQLFFISFAQIWCGKSTPLGLFNSVRSDSHSPGRYRVIGTLSNSEDFARAFTCKKNSTMNPASKCSFW